MNQEPNQVSNLLRDIVFEGEAILKCPTCGDEYLHQQDIAVFDRKGGEDGPGTATVVDRTGLLSQRPLTEAKMPGRRNALRITFECETCGPAPKIFEIRQHKGQTFMFWKRP